MKSLKWYLVGTAIALVVYLVLNQAGPEYSPGIDEEEDEVDAAAGQASSWGAKQRIAGTAGNLGGRLKEGAGNLTGNDELTAEGVADQVTGAVKDTAGKVAQAAGETLHKLNQ